MMITGNRRQKHGTLLERYSAQLGHIVERKIAETALLAAKQDAERIARLAETAMVESQAANGAKTQFLANMSHELRTPLNAIIGFSDMILNGLPGMNSPEKQHEYARDIHESGCHLLALINDILDLSKIEAGKLELDEELVNVSSALSSCITLIRGRAHEANLTLDHQVLPGTPPLLADERKLKQIVINLLSNAVKFTPTGGKVALRAGLMRDHSFLIEISDTGIGIAQEDIGKAFAPFRQVCSDPYQSKEGTGLGLPLSRALVELHGGTLRVDSEVGLGTTVRVHLPAQRVHRQVA